MNFFGQFIIFIIVACGLIGIVIYSSYNSGPTPEEVERLKNALPAGCVAHDIGSYGKIDNLVIIECEDRDVSASYTYMHESHGKSSETDRAAVYVIR
jgi:hypothetical protein